MSLVSGTLMTGCPCLVTGVEDSTVEGTLGKWDELSGEGVLEVTVCDLGKDPSCVSETKIVGGQLLELFEVDVLPASDVVCIEVLFKECVETGSFLSLFATLPSLETVTKLL